MSIPRSARARELFRKRLKVPGEAAAAAARPTVDLAAEHVGSADIVIERSSKTRKRSARCSVTSSAKLPAAALVATNTSSIRLEELSDGFARPGALGGLPLLQSGREPAARRGHPRVTTSEATLVESHVVRIADRQVAAAVSQRTGFV